MIEIITNFFIEHQGDFDFDVMLRPGWSESWSVVHACKEPYNRQALGYTGRSAPKDHPEYQVAYRENRMILNLVDVPEPKYISAKIIDLKSISDDEVRRLCGDAVEQVLRQKHAMYKEVGK